MANNIKELLAQPNSEYPFGPDWYEITEVALGTTAIREPHHFEDVFSFTKATANGGLVLFDTGMGLANIKNILPMPPVRTLLTHSHWDHIGGAGLFKNVSILDSQYETSRLRAGWRKDETVGYDEEAFLVKVPSSYDLNQFNIPGIESFETFKDGDVINIDGLHVVVIHTPGHTPGSVCFFLPQSGELITGDTLYPGPEYLHLAESSVNDYLQSLYRLRSELGNKITAILPGHNQPSAEPDLLNRHIAAFEGSLTPTEIIEGVDEFGPYEQRKFAGFSLMLPK